MRCLFVKVKAFVDQCLFVLYLLPLAGALYLDWAIWACPIFIQSFWLCFLSKLILAECLRQSPHLGHRRGAVSRPAEHWVLIFHLLCPFVFSLHTKATFNEGLGDSLLLDHDMGCAIAARGDRIACWHSTVDWVGQNFAAWRQIYLNVGPRSVYREVSFTLFRLLCIWTLESSNLNLLLCAWLLLYLMSHIFERWYVQARFADAFVGLLFRLLALALDRKIKFNRLLIPRSGDFLFPLFTVNLDRFLHIIA